MKNNIKIAFFGNSKFSVFCLEEMKRLGQTPSLIVTTPDKPIGRKMILTKSETKAWAEENNVPFLEQEKLKEEVFLAKLKDYDLFLVASYGKIIPKVILDMPKYGILNIHPSLLPKYRGPSPLQEQILNDEKNIGVTLMIVDEEVDHGPIIASQGISLALEGNSLAKWPVNIIELKKITAKAGVKLFVDNLEPWIKGEAKIIEQDHSQATFTKKIIKADGLIDINTEPYKNYLKYLAYFTWPQTYFFVEKQHNRPLTPSLTNEGGKEEMRVLIKEAEFKDGEFIIKRIIPEGKKEMSYDDFLRGFK